MEGLEESRKDSKEDRHQRSPKWDLKVIEGLDASRIDRKEDRQWRSPK